MFGRMSALTLLPLAMLACKTTRPVIDISEPVYKEPKSTLPSTTGEGSPFEVPESATVKTMDSSISTDDGQFTIYGLGLYASLVSILDTDLSPESLADLREGTYAAGCRPFKGDEWKSAGIAIEAGRLYGIDLYFLNDRCSGEPARQNRDSRSTAYSDFVKVMLGKGIKTNLDDKGMILAFPSGDSVILNRLSFVTDTTPLPAGELPMGTTLLTSGLGLSPFVKSKRQALRESDPLQGVGNPEFYASVCKPFDTSESYVEAIRIQDGLVRGANIFYDTRDCTGAESSQAADDAGVAFLDYAEVLQGLGTSVSKSDLGILLSEKTPDGFSQMTLYRKLPFAAKASAPSISAGLGLTESVLDALNVRATENEAGYSLADGYYMRGCVPFTGKSWKSTGYYVTSGTIYGVELYFPRATCKGTVVSGVSDQFHVFLSDFSKALKKAGTLTEFGKEGILLTYASGAEALYAPTEVSML